MIREPVVPEPPGHLSPEAATWWRSVVADYSLEPHHHLLLQGAAEAWDRQQEARRVLEAEGTTYMDRFGQPRPRPEVAIERDARIAFARLLRELALDHEGGPAESRPPRPAGY